MNTSGTIGYLRTFAICVALAFGLPACSPTQLLQAQTEISTGIQAVCTDVATAAKLNPASPVVVYAEAACPLGIAASSLVQNSATLVWLGQIQQQLSTPAAVPAKS